MYLPLGAAPVVCFHYFSLCITVYFIVALFPVFNNCNYMRCRFVCAVFVKNFKFCLHLKMPVQSYVSTDYESMAQCNIVGSALLSDGNNENGVLNGYINCTGKGTYRGKTVFVKMNKNSGGEKVGLETIAATGEVKVPRPLQVRLCGQHGGELILEHMDMRPLSAEAEGLLGYQLACMHLDNIQRPLWCVGRKTKKRDSWNIGHDAVVKSFGFVCPTSCGYILNDNTWENDWTVFYTRRVQNRMDFYLCENQDRVMEQLWEKVKTVIPRLFSDTCVYPSLLHGDLWPGNTAMTADGKPVLFDPATFYGHHEYDLACGSLFASFGDTFYDEYHKIIPQCDSLYFTYRQKLYQFYYFLNQHTHWQYYQKEPQLMEPQVGIDMLEYILEAPAP
ncbi:ketosamine-3-kinase-like isoform X2 [Paramacrobiotus metropolitanus]|uniref:ketosamine-3-kinase-like isoform X2 n=1 Tax=Paramacrobiotus metropolitanus TaxID=2943436 RepID=UPI00244650EA|nr:ketosamine-3-kinase-like isoform X2 [Paramacrobiotus metropolitanus]